MDEKVKKYIMDKYMLSDEEKQASQDNAAQLDLLAGLSKAGNMIGSSMARVKPIEDYGSDLSSLANKERADLSKREADKMKMATLEDTVSKQMEEKDLKDPMSEASKRRRAMLGKIAGKAGLNVEGMSAQDFDTALPWAKEIFDMEGKRQQMSVAAMDRQERQQLKRDEAKEKEVERLMKSTPEAAGLMEKAKRLKQTLSKDDVAGIGRIKTALPDFMMSNEAQANRQDIRGIVADLIKMQSGTAASEKEVDRKLAEMGYKAGSDIETLRRGLDNLINETSERVKSKQAGYSPEAIQTYKQRGGLTADDIKSINQAQQQQATSGEVRRKTKDGRIAIFNALTKEFIRYE